jgi:flavin reductase (DIM6/NTAB) family NADH-FMN oxidoreductase RutF
MSELVTDAVERLVSPTRFRSLMSAFPAGVAIVTTVDDDGLARGLTCSSVSSVSVRPPTILVCIDEGSSTLAALLRGGTFAVNFLHDGATAAAEAFADPEADRFSRVRWTGRPGAAGPHLVDDAHAVADCRLTRRVAVGDHVVVFGEVYDVNLPADAPASPLLYGFRGYWSMDRERHRIHGPTDVRR